MSVVSGVRAGRAVLDPSTLTRTALLTAGLGVVGIALAKTLGPALIQAFGDAGAQASVAVLGVLLRAVAGAVAGRRAWRRAERLGSVLLSTGVGAAVGYLAFPGSLGLLGLAVTGARVSSYASLLAATGLAVVACVAGAVAARPRQGPAG